MELYLRGALGTRKIHTMVLDEADRMMDMGFMPQLRDILEVVPNKRQNLLFQRHLPATCGKRLADEFLLWPTRIEVTPEGTPEVGAQYITRVPNIQTKINAVLHWLTDTHPDSRALLSFAPKKMPNAWVNRWPKSCPIKFQKSIPTRRSTHDWRPWPSSEKGTFACW